VETYAGSLRKDLSKKKDEGGRNGKTLMFRQPNATGEILRANRKKKNNKMETPGRGELSESWTKGKRNQEDQQLIY